MAALSFPRLLSFSTLLVLSSLLLPSPTEQYCIAAGANPTFNGPPEVRQGPRPDLVTVLWNGKVDRLDCADQYRVKHWVWSEPNEYDLSPMLANNVTQTTVEVLPRVKYGFQVIAREDKGFLGVEYNRSPVVFFATSTRKKKNSPPLPTSESPSVLPRGGLFSAGSSNTNSSSEGESGEGGGGGGDGAGRNAVLLVLAGAAALTLAAAALCFVAWMVRRGAEEEEEEEERDMEEMQDEKGGESQETKEHGN